MSWKGDDRTLLSLREALYPLTKAIAIIRKPRLPKSESQEVIVSLWITNVSVVGHDDGVG